MAMTVVCPSCARKLNVPDNLIGELVKCPVCGQNFKVEAEPEQVSPAREIQAVRPPKTPQPVAAADDRPDKDEDDPRWEFSARKRRDLEPHRGTLILVLGILSICMGVTCFGVGLILGPIAWILGSKDLKAIRAGHMDPMGEGSTKAGYVCGIVGTCLQLVSCLGCFGLNAMQALVH